MNPELVYIVLGMHRSGTSVVARMLKSMGIPLGGKLIGPAPDNEKGFWEDKDIVEINNKLFEKLGISWHSLNGFAKTKNELCSKELADLSTKACSIVRERLDQHPVWAFKDPRATRVLPFWQSVLEKIGCEAKYVLTYRTPNDVQASLKARNGFNDVKSQWLWIRYYMDALKFLMNEDQWALIRYESVLNDPLSAINNLCTQLNIDPASLDAQEIETFQKHFIDPRLRHQQNTQATTTKKNRFSDTIYSALRQLELSKISRDEFDQIIHTTQADLTSDSEVAVLLDYLGESEIQGTKETQKLTDQLATQFTDYHAEESRLIRSIEELTKTNEHQSHKIKKQEDAIESLSAAKADSLLAQVESEQTTKTLTEKLERLTIESTQIATKLSKKEHELTQEKLKLDSAQDKSAQFSKALEDALMEKQNFSISLQQLEIKLSQSEETNSKKIEAREKEFELEKKRLWDIVEKYRILSEAKQSFFVKFRKACVSRTAKILGIENGQDKSLLFLFKHKTKLVARNAVYLLPKESILRHKIVQSYLRVRYIVKGELDGKELRACHNRLIQNRQTLSHSTGVVEPHSLPDLDIIVVSHNNGKWIESFLNSLSNQNYPLSKISLVVVENGSTDETLTLWQTQKKFLTSKFKQFSIHQNKNVGFGQGNNLGFKHSSAPYVLVSNVDLEFAPDAITNILAYAVKDGLDVASWELRQHPFEHPKYYDPVSLETSWSSHACVLIRRECFEAVNGYEKRIFMYGEDVELSYRFRAHGYRIKYFPKSLVYHYTYEDVDEVKPLQFAGSTLANSYIRMRYGSFTDIISIPGMYTKLLFADIGLPGARSMIVSNIRKILFNTPYFLTTRLRKENHFPLRRWDYEMIRDGSFYTEPKTKSSHKGTKRPLASVITRTYQGREYYLKEALSSIVNQTYPNIEIVVVEDGGSTMQALIEEFSLAHPLVDFRYQALPKRGRCNAGNKGLELASGQYNMFLDDDDLLFCDHIETSISELEKNQDIGAVYALSWDVETKLKGESINDGYIEMSHSTTDVLRQEFDREVLMHHNYISIQSILFRRELYEEHGGFDEELDNLEDWNLWVRYASKSEFKLINKTTSMFRTPWNVAEKSRRQLALDNYYEIALRKNKKYLSSLGNQ